MLAIPEEFCFKFQILKVKQNQINISFKYHVFKTSCFSESAFKKVKLKASSAFLINHQVSHLGVQWTLSTQVSHLLPPTPTVPPVQPPTSHPVPPVSPPTLQTCIYILTYLLLTLFLMRNHFAGDHKSSAKENAQKTSMH